MKNSPSIALLMPTLNEVEGLNLVFPRINRDLFDDVALHLIQSTELITRIFEEKLRQKM